MWLKCDNPCNILRMLPGPNLAQECQLSLFQRLFLYLVATRYNDLYGHLKKSFYTQIHHHLDIKHNVSTSQQSPRQSWESKNKCALKFCPPHHLCFILLHIYRSISFYYPKYVHYEHLKDTKNSERAHNQPQFHDADINTDNMKIFILLVFYECI